MALDNQRRSFLAKNRAGGEAADGDYPTGKGQS